MSLVLQRAAELAEELSYLDREEKFEWLIHRGKKLSTSSEFTDADFVKGCQSKVWIRVSVSDDRVRIEGTSDAFIVKGIIGLLVELFDGAPRSEVREFDFVAWMGENGLSLSFQRMQGLAGMLQRIRTEIG